MAQTKTSKRTTRKVVKGRRRKNALHPEPPMSYWREMAVQGREAGNTLQMIKAQAMPDLDQYAAVYRSRALGEMERGYRSRQNSFLGAIAEGAGTGIGLGLAGAAALPMVRKAFPGLMRGKANPEVVTHRSGLPIAYSDQVGRGSGTLKSGETVDYTVKGQRVSYAWTDRNGTAWKGTTSLKNFKAYTTDERTIVDKVLGRKSAHERGLWKPFPKSNPADTAEAMYETFHGVPPTGYEELIEERHYHADLSELGSLYSIKVVPYYGRKRGKTLELDFSKADVMLCSNEEGNQMYFRGGNQEIDPRALGLDDPKYSKDLMCLGQAAEITYETRKAFDKLKPIQYYHQLSEESKDAQPELLYDVRNQELLLAGGSYQVRDIGVVD